MRHGVSGMVRHGFLAGLGCLVAFGTACAEIKRVGQCEDTRIANIGTRLIGVPDSGSAVKYANGVTGVSYDGVPALVASREGDPVRLCLVEVPRRCPKGDDRGRLYEATNLRTGAKWRLQNSAHSCGGA